MDWLYFSYLLHNIHSIYSTLKVSRENTRDVPRKQLITNEEAEQELMEKNFPAQLKYLSQQTDRHVEDCYP